MAIRAVLIFNNQGKPRLTKFYAQLPTSSQQSLLRLIFSLVSRRPDNDVCNFLDAPELRPYLGSSAISANGTAGGSASSTRKGKAAGGASATGFGLDSWDSLGEELRVIYRHYATLYFIFVVDGSESELGILDLIQVFVESLDRMFSNVCELDLIFHFDEVHAILSEIIQGGVVLETNLHDIVASAREAQKARKQSESGPSSSTSSGGGGALGPNPFGPGAGAAWDLMSNVGSAGIGMLRSTAPGWTTSMGGGRYGR